MLSAQKLLVLTTLTICCVLGGNPIIYENMDDFMNKGIKDHDSDRDKKRAEQGL